jgi:geranylgeranyl pyrophosphate synthase
LESLDMSSTSPAGAVDIANLTAPAKLVEPYLQSFLETRVMPANLRNAVLYAAMAPGKRMRPVLAIRSCQAVGGEPSQALPPAAAIELIHAFSLVHDDLPAMDDDDLRRGRPTLHKHTNDAMAILAGDAMMSLAYDVIFSRITDPAKARDIANELTIGTNEMIAGQVYDTLPDFAADVAPIDRLKTIHRHKTGALIRVACRMGAMCGNASDDQLQSLTDFGEAIGLMFQVVDDLLDVTQTTEQLGKTAGKDVEQDKLTYPAVLGIDRTRDEVTRLQNAAHDALASLGPAAQPLHDLCDFMAVRTK